MDGKTNWAIMVQIEIVEPELLKNLCEIEAGDKYVDLHNDYDCTRIKFSKQTQEFSLGFIPCKDAKVAYNHVNVIFKETSINNVLFEAGDIKDILTIDNLYRGRYEESNMLKEKTEDGKRYYYIEFCKGYSFELFASKVVFHLS